MPRVLLNDEVHEVDDDPRPRVVAVGAEAPVRLLVAEVLQLLQLQSQTGCIEIRRDDFRVLVYLRDGLVDLVQWKRLLMRVASVFSLFAV